MQFSRQPQRGRMRGSFTRPQPLGHANQWESGAKCHPPDWALERGMNSNVSFRGSDRPAPAGRGLDPPCVCPLRAHILSSMTTLVSCNFGMRNASASAQHIMSCRERDTRKMGRSERSDPLLLTPACGAISRGSERRTHAHQHV
eukprot:1812812-Prymnesium_polylepis.1